MRLSALLVSAATIALAAPAFAQTGNVQSTPSTPDATQQVETTTTTPVQQGSVEQNAPESASQREPVADTGNAGDIVVTATRRSERLADVPLAVSAVSSETLSNSGANDIRQLNQIAPSLLVSSTGSEANASARIRGVGTVGDNPGLESSVAVFIDGVYRSRTGSGLNDLGEIDRIEVLRGPQGTLSGRNASAGVINVYTKAPEFNFGGTAEATYGNYDNVRLVGGLTGPIIQDKLAARIDGLYQKRDGFFRDVNTGYRVNNRDRYMVRGQLLFEPSSDFSIRLIGDYTHRSEDCCAAVYATQDVAPANLNLISTANPIIPILTGVARTTFEGYFPAAGDPYSRRIAISPGRNYAGTTEDYGVSGQVEWDLGGVNLTSITAYREYSNSQQADADYGLADILYFGPDSGRRFKTFSQELRLNGKLFSDRVDWLVGGYYANEKLNTTSQLNFGADYGRFASCRIIGGGALSTFFSPTSTGCLSATGRAVLSGVVPGVASPFGAAGPTIVAALDRLDTVRNVGDNSAVFNQKSENFAFFTHNIIHLIDRLDLTLGARYTNETKTLNAYFNNTNTACPTQQAALTPLLANAGLATVAGGIISLTCQGNSSSALNAITLNDQRKEDRFTGTAVLSYKPTNDLLVYASYSKGYKAGGFNLDRSAFVNPTGQLALPIGSLTQANAAFYANNLQFDEETVNAYEVGLKYSSRQFSLNIAGFRQEFSNFQLNTFNGTVYIVQNINGCKDSLNGLDRDTNAATGSCSADRIKPGLVSQGVEIEGSLVPARNLRVGVGLTYADTQYADNLVGSDTGRPLDPQLRLLPDQQISNAPKVVVTNSVTWTPEIGSTGLRGLFYVDSRTSSDYNTGSDLFPQKEQDGFTTVNARIGLRGRNELWAIELWAQNIFDVNYQQVGFSSPFQATGSAAAYTGAQYPGNNQIFSSYLAEPRTYGVTLRTRF